MIDPELMKQCRMQVLDTHSVLNRSIADLIRGTIHETRFETTTGQYGAECISVMIAAQAVLRYGQSTKLARPDHNGRIKESSLLQILDQRA